MAPRTGGSRVRTLAVLVGALVVVGIVVGGLLLFTGGGSGQGAYRLTTPRTVAGEYQRQGHGVAGKGDRIALGGGAAGAKKAGKKVPGMEIKGYVSAPYQAHQGEQMSFNGAYGEVSDPGKGVDWLLNQERRQLAEIGAKPQGGKQSLKPEGFSGGTLKCQEYEVRSSGKPVALAYCSWGDGSTLGSVTLIRLKGSQSMTVPLEEAAGLTAKVRTGARAKA